MTKRPCFLLFLLIAGVAVADEGPFADRYRPQVSPSQREVRPEPPPPREERTRSSVVLRTSRPPTPRLAGLAPSFIDASPAVSQAPFSPAGRVDCAAVPRLSVTPFGPSPSRAPPLA